MGGVTDVELASVAVGALLGDEGEVDAVVVSEVVEVASVVVAVKAETMPVLKVPIMMRLITRTLTAENAIVCNFIQVHLIIILFEGCNVSNFGAFCNYKHYHKYCYINQLSRPMQQVWVKHANKKVP